MLLETHEFLGVPKFLGENRNVVAAPPAGLTTVNLFGSSVPGGFIATDSSGYTLGTRVKILADCEVIALRFYRSATDADTTSRTLQLWNNATSGLIATATTTEVAGSAGWVQESITPVPLTAGMVVVASYNKPAIPGIPGYSAVNGYFGGGFSITSGCLKAISDGEDGLSNGCYWDSVNNFPGGTFGSSCYFADLVARY